MKSDATPVRPPARKRDAGRARVCLGMVGLGLLLLVAIPGEAVAAAAPRYPIGDAAAGYAAEVTNPTGSPPGVNVWSCRPSARHPYPVVLLPGTFYDLAESFQALGPMLADQGYCVFGLNYGDDRLTALTGGRVWAVGPIERSAQQLAGFVGRVLAVTGARQVDIVGWSQGGMMPRWYLRFGGGAARVHELVGLAPSNHGTTVNGLLVLLDADTAAGLPAPLALADCEACTEQQTGSAFLTRLNSDGDTVPGVRYVVIETTHDEVVTPYTSAFLSGRLVENVLLQRRCPADATDHLGIIYDSAALQDVADALGSGVPGYRPRCDLPLPVLGSV
jgi:triacylglycerol esterase/lipase EstA (alpha/beta hydrolase family)